MSNSGFKKSRLWTLAITIGVTFLTTLLAVLFLRDSVQESPQTNSFSKSSIGHELLVETLRGLDYDVRINRRSPPGPEVDGQLVIFAEPDLSSLPSAEELDLLIQRAGAVLLVLPKRSGIRDPENPGRLIDVSESDDQEQVLRQFMPDRDASVVTAGAIETVRWQENYVGIDPDLDDVNLIKSENLHPLISTKDGILFGMDLYYQDDLYVLSDPDIFATHGFIRGDNAQLAIQIIHDILPQGGAVIFDESSHGFTLSDSFWQEMFRYPLNLLSAHIVLILLILMWITSRRLGKTLKSPPAIPAGKKYLLENIVKLLSFYRHDGFMVSRYMRNVIRQTANQLRIKGSDAEIEERLAVISRAKKIEFNPTEWRQDLSARLRSSRGFRKRLLSKANQVHKWKKEMLDES